MSDTITFRCNPVERKRIRALLATMKAELPYRSLDMSQTRGIRVALLLATRALDCERSKDKRRAMLEEALEATSQWGRLEEADKDARGL